jgi:hypothetical protein
VASAVASEAFDPVGSKGAEHGSAFGAAEDLDFADVAGGFVGADAADDGVEAAAPPGAGTDVDAVAEDGIKPGTTNGPHELD